MIKSPNSHLVDIIDASTGLNRKASFDSKAFGVEVNKRDLMNMIIVQPKSSRERPAHDSFFGYFNNRFMLRLAYSKGSKKVDVLEWISLDRSYSFSQPDMRRVGNLTQSYSGGSHVLAS